jgi:hypothetical protein
MINQQLLDYVRAQRSAGLSKEAITQALSAGGWTPNDVNEAFMAIEGVRTPPPPPGPPLQPIVPRTIVPPPGAPMPQSTPQMVQRPIVAASEFSTAPMGVRRRRVWPLLTFFIIILLIVGGVGAVWFLNPELLTSNIPSLEMFFPTEQAQTTLPPPESTPLDINNNSGTTSTTAPTTTPSSNATNTSTTAPAP